MSKDYEKHSGPGFMSGVFWGTLVGAVLGVLYAPKSGEETRKKLKDTADKVQEKGEKVIGEAKVLVDDVKVASEPLVSELEKKLKPILHQAKNASKDVQVELMEKIEELVREAADASDKTSKTMKKFLDGKKK